MCVINNKAEMQVRCAQSTLARGESRSNVSMLHTVLGQDCPLKIAVWVHSCTRTSEELVDEYTAASVHNEKKTFQLMWSKIYTNVMDFQPYFLSDVSQAISRTDLGELCDTIISIFGKVALRYIINCILLRSAAIFYIHCQWQVREFIR